jgi:hypothetical protein
MGALAGGDNAYLAKMSARICHEVRRRASNLLEDDPLYRARSEDAARRAHADLDHRGRRLRQRAVIEPAARARVDVELAANDAVLAALLLRMASYCGDPKKKSRVGEILL